MGADRPGVSATGGNEKWFPPCPISCGPVQERIGATPSNTEKESGGIPLLPEAADYTGRPREAERTDHATGDWSDAALAQWPGEKILHCCTGCRWRHGSRGYRGASIDWSGGCGWPISRHRRHHSNAGLRPVINRQALSRSSLDKRLTSAPCHCPSSRKTVGTAIPAAPGTRLVAKDLVIDLERDTLMCINLFSVAHAGFRHKIVCIKISHCRTQPRATST